MKIPNIAEVIDILNKNSINDQKIADTIGTTQPTVFRIRKGIHKSFTYTIGRKIEQLAKDKGLI